MKISGVFELVHAQNAAKSTVVKAKVLNQSPKNKNIYTVSLGNDVEISVAFSKEDLKAGDVVEIPVSLLKQVDQGFAFIGADNVELKSSTLDKLMNLLTEISSSGNSIKSSDSNIAMLHTLISLLPEEEQEALFQKILEKVVQGSTGIDGEEIAKGSNVTNSSDWAVKLVADFIGELVEELPGLYETLPADKKDKVLDVLSSLLQRSVADTNSLKGVRPFDTALVGNSLLHSKTAETAVEDDQGAISRSPELNELLSAKSESAIIVTSDKLLAVVEKISMKDSLWTSSYNPVKNDLPLGNLHSEPPSVLHSGSKNDLHYVSIFRESDVPKELQKLLQIRFPVLHELYERIPTQPVLSTAVSMESLELLENKLSVMINESGRAVLPNSDSAAIAPKEPPTQLLMDFPFEKDPFLLQSTKVAMVELLEKGETPVFYRIVSQVEPIVALAISLEQIVELASEITTDIQRESKLPASLQKSLQLFEAFYRDMIQKVESLIDPDVSTTNQKHDSIKVVTDLWGMFFENRVKESEVKNDLPQPGLKQHLQILSKEITSALISKSLQNESVDENQMKDVLKHIQKEVTESISKIEGSQILSQPKETPAEKEQTLWLPVNIGGEWTRLGLEIKRDGKGKGKQSKLGSRVNIHMELKKMGRVTAELDLDANKQLRVKLGATETKAMKWFKEHEQDIVESLDNGALKSVIFSLTLPSAQKERAFKQDSFQVSG